MDNNIFKSGAMAWWGLLLGGVLGYFIRGPVGALVGVVLGYNLEKGIMVVRRHIAPGFDESDNSKIQALFFTTTFSVMGHIARSDGSVNKPEIALAKEVMIRMKLGQEQKKAAGRLFNEGKRPDFPFETVLTQLKKECEKRRDLLRMFIEIQLQSACADGEINVQERKLLVQMAKCLGFSRQEFDQLTAMVHGQLDNRVSPESMQVKPIPDDKDAYDILGVSRISNDKEIKSAYRRLISQHHPDKLVAKGLPEEMMKLASDNMQKIKQAYETIKHHRK